MTDTTSPPIVTPTDPEALTLTAEQVEALAGHTPGPWKVDHRIGCMGVVAPHLTESPGLGHDYVGVVAYWWPGEHVVDRSGPWPHEDRPLADAALIAAAPALRADWLRLHAEVQRLAAERDQLRSKVALAEDDILGREAPTLTVSRLSDVVELLNVELAGARACYETARRERERLAAKADDLAAEVDRLRTAPPMTDAERDAMIAETRELRARVEAAERAFAEIIGSSATVAAIDGTAGLAAAAAAVHHAALAAANSDRRSLDGARTNADRLLSLLRIVGVETHRDAILVAARLGGAK